MLLFYCITQAKQETSGGRKKRKRNNRVSSYQLGPTFYKPRQYYYHLVYEGVFTINYVSNCLYGYK